MKNIGICVIAYNRVDSLKRVLHTLEKAYYPQCVDLNISIDKSDTDIVEKYAVAYRWEYGKKNVIIHQQNMGLRKHVLSCGELLDEYDALIVLEDDISVAPSFFAYALQCVEKYATDDDIGGISLYNFPVVYHNNRPFIPLKTDSDVYLMKCAQSWGQVWMKRQWIAFRKWYDENCTEFSDTSYLPRSICSWPKSSWLKYHTRYCIEKNKYFVYPYMSLSTNNGDPGEHIQESSTLFQAPLLYGLQKEFKLNPTVKYDGFFENEKLYEALGLNESECCIDFYGEKNNREKKRYWLTTLSQSYKLIASYGLFLKPYELNVLYQVEGNGLFLYDTTVESGKKLKSDFDRLMFYFYNYDFSFKNILKGLIKKIFCKKYKY